MAPFGEGLIERNSELFFSGYVKPLTDDSPTIEGAVPVMDGGAIVEWWCAGNFLQFGFDS